MLMLMQLTGIVLGVIGILAAGWPALFRSALEWWDDSGRLPIASLLKAIVGVVWVAGAAQTRWPMALTVLGGVLVVGGIVGFFLGPARMRALVCWWLRQPVVVLRAWGVATVALGLFVVVATR